MPSLATVNLGSKPPFLAAQHSLNPRDRHCLAASPARYAKSQGRYRPMADRAFGHAASPRRCTRHPGLPASRARRSPAAPPDCAQVCFGRRPKRSRRFIRLPRPVAPFACSRRANLPSKHTHMSVEAYPPDGPQISPPQGSQNFSARAGRVGSSVQCAPPRWRRRRASKTFAPGKPAAPPSLTRADSVNRTFGHATTLTWWFPEHLETPTWLTTTRTPMRPSNFSA